MIQGWRGTAPVNRLCSLTTRGHGRCLWPVGDARTSHRVVARGADDGRLPATRPNTRIAPSSASAGEKYFGETGLGDPYAAGLPYPVLLAMMRAYPDDLGADWAAFCAKFGALPRDRAQGEGDDAALPVGFHLTTDPFTKVGFVMNNCELCHAERLRLPQGDVFVPGLGNKRIRIHAYDAALARIARDPGFTSEHLMPLADEAAREHGLAWSPSWRTALLDATIRNLKERQRIRADGVERLKGGLPGRVATIESFMMALGATDGHVIPPPPTTWLDQDPRRTERPVQGHTELGWRRHGRSDRARRRGGPRVWRSHRMVRYPPPPRDEPLHVPARLRAKASFPGPCRPGPRAARARSVRAEVRSMPRPLRGWRRRGVSREGHPNRGGRDGSCA